MPKVSPIQNNFSAGELSELLYGREDVPRYSSGLGLCKNYVPLVQGPVTRRPGSIYVADAKNGATRRARLIPFQYSTEQAYIIELSHLAMRFYANGARVGGGTPTEIATVFTEDDLFDIKFVQDANVMYLVHPAHPPQKLVRTAATPTFAISAVDFQDGPYLPAGDGSVSITVTGAGPYTLTASAATFASTDVGRLVRVWDSAAGTPRWHWFKISAYSSGTVVTATLGSVVAPTLSAAFTLWRFGAFHAGGAVGNYPKAVALFEQRAVYAGTEDNPQDVYFSALSDLEGFYPTQNDGTVTDAEGFVATLVANDVNAIQWILDDEQGLIIGTTGGEWIISPTSTTVTPTGTALARSSTYGSANLQGVRISKTILFAQRSGRKIRELRYSDLEQGFDALDLSVLAEHLMKGGFDQFAISKIPHPIVWAVRADGVMLGLTYEREQDVVGWHQHVVGGVSDSNGADAIVESIAVIPSSSGDRDEIWLSVKRYVNGATVRHVEYLDKFWENGDSVETVVVGVDSAVSQTGASSATWSGFDHLEGETLSVRADGAAHPDVTVSSGSITLSREATKVVAGLRYDSDIRTLRVTSGAADGTAQGKTKRINKLHVMMWQTLGMLVGESDTELDEVTFRTTATPMGSAPDLFTGIMEMPWEASYNLDGYIYLRQSQPFPGTILAMLPQLHTQDR